MSCACEIQTKGPLNLPAVVCVCLTARRRNNNTRQSLHSATMFVPVRQSPCVRMRMCVCACVCMCARARARMSVLCQCRRVYVLGYVSTLAPAGVCVRTRMRVRAWTNI